MYREREKRKPPQSIEREREEKAVSHDPPPVS